MKILIVEDDDALARVLQEKFEKEKVSARVARNGVEALEMLKSDVPDIIALDLVMPQMDGFAVLEALKRDNALKLIPVIVLSNLDNDEEIKKALRLGAVDYFVKSNHPIMEIVEKVKALLVSPKIQK